MPFTARGLEPDDFDGLLRVANMIAASGLAPKHFTSAASIAVAIAFGRELGISTMASIQSVCVVNGFPSLYGDAMLGIVAASGLLDDFSESMEGDGENLVAICRVKRKGWASPVERKYSVADAKTAKLWGKTGASGNPSAWVTNPRRMLQFRARAFALRDGFPDVLRGIGSAEELSDA